MNRRAERGSVSVLVVGFFLVAVLLVAVVVDVSAAYLRRQQLDAVADGAALAAAEAVQSEQVYVGGLGDRARLDPGAARGHVADYLGRIGARERYPGLTYRVRTTADSVQVTVSTLLDLPFTPDGWVGRARVTGRAAAYVEILD